MITASIWVAWFGGLTIGISVGETAADRWTAERFLRTVFWTIAAGMATVRINGLM